VEQHSLRVLLVEDDLAEGPFLPEELAEAATLSAWPGNPGVEVFSIDTLEDACDLAFDGAFDAVLVDLSVRDSTVPRETLAHLRSVAPGTPILILAGDDDPVLAGHLLREGAQDVLVRKSIHAVPLAISIRNAIERQRFVNAARFTQPRPFVPAILPVVREDDDLLLSLVRVAAVTARGPDAETVMLAD
jgi:DNA-binding NarL/FixJ family response regulator